MSDGKPNACTSVPGLLVQKVATGAVLRVVAFWSLFSPASWDDLDGLEEKSPIWGVWWCSDSL